jgi:hypothetical protein
MHGIVEAFYHFSCRFNKSQSVSSDALNALFYIDELLKDLEESETVEQTKVFLNDIRSRVQISVIPKGLRKAVNMACGKLEKYISNADPVDAIYLSSVLHPRYKKNIIESN